MSFRERWALTWSMTWPLLLVDALAGLLVHGALKGEASAAETIFQVLSFFVLGPLILRRALRQGTQQHFVVAAAGNPGADVDLGIGDAFSIFWLLGWRSLILALLALVPLSLLLKSIVPAGFNAWVREVAASPAANALGLTIVDGIMNMAFVPFLIPGMLRKRYKRFSLELRRRETTSNMKSVSRNSAKRNLPMR